MAQWRVLIAPDRTKIQFPAPMTGSSQLHVTPAPGGHHDFCPLEIPVFLCVHTVNISIHMHVCTQSWHMGVMKKISRELSYWDLLYFLGNKMETK